eukprot:6938384-Ditylum_brightwellii.AAC.1
MSGEKLAHRCICCHSITTAASLASSYLQPFNNNSSIIEKFIGDCARQKKMRSSLYLLPFNNNSSIIDEFISAAIQ